MKKSIIANWKMHNLNTDVEKFCAELRLSPDVEVMIAPSFTALATAVRCVDKGVGVLAQNVHYAERGAFTGEVSIPMLRELGVCGAIIGHSERRQLFAETDDLLNKKVCACLSQNLRVIFCVGETARERASAETFKVLEGQLAQGLAGTDAYPANSANLIIAYEPVWAIGTGKVATTAQITEVHRYLRRQTKNTVPIVYGGSVNARNVTELLALPEVSGVLVGGASVKIETFNDLLDATSL